MVDKYEMLLLLVIFTKIGEGKAGLLVWAQMRSDLLVTVSLVDTLTASNVLIQCVYYATHTPLAGWLHSVCTWQWAMFSRAALL